MMLDHALKLGDQGYAVFPLDGKLPLAGSRGFKDATKDQDGIYYRWDKNYNIGIATGVLSGCWVLDVDPRHGGDKSLAELERKYGSLPKTRMVRTGTDGLHYYFQAIPGIDIRNSASRVGPGIDVRGDGGYVVADQSIHPDTKKPYVLVNDMAPVPAPEWLVKLATATPPPTSTASPNGEGIPEGQRNAFLTSIAGSMRRRGCSREAITAALLSENATRCKPPLSENEVHEIARSVSRYEPAPNPPAPEPKQSPPRSPIKTWEDIPDALSIPARSTEWIVEELLARNSMTLITGLPGNYKSWLAMALMRSVALGGPFLGRQCVPCPVLYLDRENPLAVVQKRLAILGIESPNFWKYWGRWLPDMPPMIGDFRLLEIAKEFKPLMIFDSLIRFHTGDENSAKDMAQVMDGLRRLTDVGAAVLPLHHKSRAEGSQYRGSSDILGAPDTAYSVSRDRAAGTVKVDCFKSRFIEEFTITLRPDLSDRGEFTVIEAPEVTEEHENVSKILEIIRANEGIHQERIIDLAGLPKAKTRSILQQYTGRYWRCTNGAKNAKCFFVIFEAEI